MSAAIVPVFAMLALGFLFVTQFLLQQHGDITTRHERRLVGNIERMEQDMSDSLLILEKAEQQAMDILVSLAELCRESAIHLDTFVAQVASVQVQADTFASTVAQLGDVNEALHVHHQDVDDAFHQICGVLSASSLTLTQQPGALQDITQKLDETHLSLVTNSHTLADLCAALADQVVSLSSLTPIHRPAPIVLSSGQPKGDADGSRTSLSDETVTLNETTHALLEDGENFLEQLRAYRLKRTPSTDSPSSVNGIPVSPPIDKAHALTEDPSTKSTPFRR